MLAVWHAIRCTGRTADLSIVSDGVSCEACHGAASQLAGAAYHGGVGENCRTIINTRRASECKNTKDLIRRAEVCIGCHVGQADTGDGSRGDVTHELIAAGHPRLAFEFSAYMANMPVHWNPAAHAAKSEASAWVVGQALTAEAAKQLRASPRGTRLDRVCRLRLLRMPP